MPAPFGTSSGEKFLRRVADFTEEEVKLLRKFENEYESTSVLDKLENVSKFGSYFELIKIKKFKFQNPRRV